MAIEQQFGKPMIVEYWRRDDREPDGRRHVQTFRGVTNQFSRNLVNDEGALIKFMDLNNSRIVGAVVLAPGDFVIWREE